METFNPSRAPSRNEFPFVRIVMASKKDSIWILGRDASADGEVWEKAGEVGLVADERPAPPAEDGRGSH